MLIGVPEPPNWLPLIAAPCLILGILGAIGSMLMEGECTCAMCTMARHEQKTGFLSDSKDNKLTKKIKKTK